MRLNRVRPLSFEGTREVLEEMSRPPEDTPERRRTMQLVHEIEAARAQRKAEEEAVAKK
jgi:hypothetical protein